MSAAVTQQDETDSLQDRLTAALKRIEDLSVENLLWRKHAPAATVIAVESEMRAEGVTPCC